MKRTFRRRPAHWVTLAALAALLVLGRLAQLEFFHDEQRPPALAEGEYAVERAVDGDTIIVVADGQRLRVRLTGIDTPEVFDPRGTGERLPQPQPYGEAASAFTKEFISGGKVRLRFGRRRIDRYDRLLAFVFVDGRMLNEELVRAGLAEVNIYAGDESSLTRRLEKAEREARQARRGIWSRD